MTDKLSERLEREAARTVQWQLLNGGGSITRQANPTHVMNLLREAAELARRVEWRPIETAPRDGIEFLSVANYTDEPSQTQIVDWDFVQQCQPGLYTHWMPLPEPPESP